MARLNNNQDYNNCVANCKSLFPNSEAALVACINGCAKVNSPADALRGDIGQLLQAEAQKIGKDEFLKKIRTAARNAGKELTYSESSEKMDPLAMQYIERISGLMEQGAKLTEWDDEALARYLNDVAWAKFATDVVSSVMAKDNPGSGGGSGPTCVTKCANEYDQCISENSCDTSGWICVCCMPCSLQYMGCVAKCTVVRGGFGGIVIA